MSDEASSQGCLFNMAEKQVPALDELISMTFPYNIKRLLSHTGILIQRSYMSFCVERGENQPVTQTSRRLFGPSTKGVDVHSRVWTSQLIRHND